MPSTDIYIYILNFGDPLHDLSFSVSHKGMHRIIRVVNFTENTEVNMILNINILRVKSTENLIFDREEDLEYINTT